MRLIVAKMINGNIILSDSERIELRQNLIHPPNNLYREEFLGEVDKMNILPAPNGFAVTWSDDIYE